MNMHDVVNFVQLIPQEIAGLTQRDWALIVISVIATILLSFILKKTMILIISLSYKYGITTLYNLIFPTPFVDRSLLLTELDVSIEYRKHDLYKKYSENPPIFDLVATCNTRYVVNQYTEETRKLYKKASKKTLNNEIFFLPSVIGFNFTMASAFIEHVPDTSYGTKQGATAKDIITNILNPCIQSAEPTIVSVFGRIGCGKSTLIETILVEYQKDNAERSNQNQYFPIVVDVRDKFKTVFESILKDAGLNQDHIDMVLECTLVESIKNICDSNFDRKYREQYRHANKLHELIHILMNDLSCTPIIVLDELDSIYSMFCKATFCLLNDVPMYEYREKYKSILRYFYTLPTDEIARGRLNNCVFIIVSRTSSERFYQEICSDRGNLTNNGMFSDVRHTIHIESFDNKYINDVIKRRLEIKKNHIVKKQRDIPDSREIIATLAAVISSIEDKPFHYEKNILISIHGLRHIMLLLGKAEMIDRQCLLLVKYIAYPSLLKTFQYLDGRPDFYSTREGVSNIFLVNTNYALDTASLKDKDYRDSVLSEHLYTYSLKYLVIGYIVACHSETNYIYLEDIYAIFTDSDCDNSQAYEYELLRLAIFHATEVEHGRLIKLAFDNKASKFYLRPSRRAYGMFDEDMFWQFGYLMVIVEDKWIELPTSIAQLFTLNKNYRTENSIRNTFDFFTNLHELNTHEQLDFLKSKAEQVLAFCYCMQVAFKFERKRYRNCFLYFESSSCTDNAMLDIVAKTHDVEVSIFEFTEKFVGSEGGIKIKSHINSIKGKLKRKVYIEMYLFYIKYHSVLSFVRIKEKMNYHCKNRRRL